MAITYREKMIADIQDVPDAKLRQFYTIIHTIKQQLFTKTETVKSDKCTRKLGTAKGLISIAEDFDAPLPNEIVNEFYK